MCTFQDSIFVDEQWKDVYGFEGFYQVSNLGRVRSLPRSVVFKDGRIVKYFGTILTPVKNSDGYFQVQLSKNDNFRTFKVHRLVATAFVPNPLNFSEINHIDEDKLNNVYTNLEWCDRLYNCQYGTRNKRISIGNGRPILLENEDGCFRFDSYTEAARWLNVRSQSVEWAKNHGTRCGGYYVVDANGR